MCTITEFFSMPLATNLLLNRCTSSGARCFATQPFGFLLNIWNAVHPIFFALSTEFEMPPAIETWNPTLIPMLASRANAYFNLLQWHFYGSSAMDSSNLSSIRLGTGDLAKYPFLNEAGEYLRQSGFGWEELDRPDMKDIIERAAERIEEGAGGRIYDKLDRYETEILTFLVALIMVKSIGMEPVLKKFALAEARRAEKFLTEDLKRQNDVQRQALFSKIFYDLFGLKIDATGDGRLFKVKVP